MRKTICVGMTRKTRGNINRWTSANKVSPREKFHHMQRGTTTHSHDLKAGSTRKKRHHMKKRREIQRYR